MTMHSLHVEVQDEALGKFMGATPLNALAELIWNAVDADASTVRVQFEETDGSGRISRILITDDGEGINEQDLQTGFVKLGKSWKRLATTTRGKARMLHGESGQGRYQSFALGHLIEWRTKFRTIDGKLLKYSIFGKRNSPRDFNYTDFEPASGKTGTTLIIDQIHSTVRGLKKGEAIEKLHKIFALYLRQYPGDPTIEVNGHKLDPSKVILGACTYDLLVEDGKGNATSVHLDVVEWAFKTEREIFLCNEKGFTLYSHPTGLRGAGANVTVYVRSPWLQELDRLRQIELYRSHELGVALEAAVLGKLQEHIEKKCKTEDAALLERLKKDKVYPYSAPPQSVGEALERRVFDECAVRVHRAMPDFEGNSTKSRKLSYRLIKEALNSNPDALTTILREVLGLTKEQQEEFAELLSRTQLSAIISASKTITDRLHFLDGLDCILFEKRSRKGLKERSQLHKLIERNTWIFGESYSLSVSDQHLNRVLDKHIQMLGRNQRNPDPVLTADGKNPGIIDLMVSGYIRHQEDELEHLIIELKRPKVAIDRKVMEQVDRYAQAVAADERFHQAKVRWRFLAISNEMTEDIRRKAKQKDRPRGLVENYDDLNVQIWAKTWAEIIEECRSRMRFYQSKLEFKPDRESALAFLRSLSPEYLPAHLRGEESA